MVRFRVLGWSLVGAFLGFLLGVLLTTQGTGLWIIVVTTAMGWAVSYFGPLVLLRGAGKAGSMLYAPSGRSTPHAKEYSLAESYVARGQYQAALDAFEEAVLEDGSDPQPYLRIARIRRDRIDDPAGAARWFARALAHADLDAGRALLVGRELLELHERRMGDPRKALPILARLAEEREGEAVGTWAAGELTRIKAELMSTEDGA